MTRRAEKKRTARAEWMIPLLVVIVGTGICYITDLDLVIARYFYDPVQHEWWGQDHPLMTLSHTWGPIFSAIAAFWALFYLFASYMHPRFWPKRAVSLFILLCILIGPVIAVNGVIKETWKRPRPRDVVEFHGSHPFRQPLQFGHWDFRGKSFPSGHASAGFILVLFYFLLKEKHRRLSWLSLLFGLGWGSWLGFVRIVQGGHFFSDCLYAFGVNWFVVWGLYYKWYLPYCRRRQKRPTFKPSWRRTLVGSVLLLAVAALLTFRFLFSTPFRIAYPESVTVLSSDLRQMTFTVRVEKGDIAIRHGRAGEVRIDTWIQGHALPDIQARRNLEVERIPDHWRLRYTVEPVGFFYEYQSHTAIYVPRGLTIHWDLFTEQGAIFREDLRPERK